MKKGKLLQELSSLGLTSEVDFHRTSIRDLLDETEKIDLIVSQTDVNIG